MSVSLSPGQIGPITELVDGSVYTAEARTPDGETFYLGMEKLDQKKEWFKWRSYVQAVDFLVADPRDRANGIIKDLAAIAFNTRKLKETRLDDDRFSRMERKDYRKLVAKLRNRGIYPADGDDPAGERYEALLKVKHGVAGFKQVHNPSYYVYASKVPIEGRVKFWEDPRSVPYHFAEIKKVTDPIIMTMAFKFIPDKPLFMHRGIFRNPLSVIEGGYSRISTMMHAFSAQFVATHQPQKDVAKTHLSVAPMPRMKQILVDSVGEENVFIEGQIPRKLRHEEPGLEGLFDTPMVVPLEHLAALHK